MLMVAMVTWNAPKRKDERDKKGLKEKKKGRERKRETEKERENERDDSYLSPSKYFCLKIKW